MAGSIIFGLDAPMVRPRWLVATLLLAVSLFGMAHIAVLPPFEGMDETAHYSSIVQIADTGTVPVLGRAYMAQEVADYQARGPMPYASQPPFEANGGQTYRSFFAGRSGAAADVPSPPFEPASTLNWQAQHPPLYYMVMAPLARATAGAALKDRLLVLRSASLLLAVAGLWVAVAANRRLFPGGEVVTAAWPLLMPGWFPEMARLGNDSLAALLMAVAWAAMAAILRGDRRPAWWALAGLSLGLGCLTKAYMVPVAVGCLGLLAWHTWRHGGRFRFTLCLALVLAVGAPWYVWLWANGISSTNDGILLASRGGLVAGLAEHWSVAVFGHSLLSVVKSFLWAGTWSFARPPTLFYLPLVAPWVLVLVGWWQMLRCRPDLAALPLAPILPMVAGLVYHCLMWLAIDGASHITGGWYMHALSAPLSLMVALSISKIGSRWLRRALVGLTAYTLTFAAAVAWLQTSLFTGCTYVSGTVVGPYRIDSACLFDAALMVERLGVLSYPRMAMVAGGLGLAAVILVFALILRNPPPAARTAPL